MIILEMSLTGIMTIRVQYPPLLATPLPNLATLFFLASGSDKLQRVISNS